MASWLSPIAAGKPWRGCALRFVFFDGEPDQLKQLAWKLHPQILVTRGEMKTPEQNLPGKPLPGPWEANFTMGTEWPFKPTNEEYKSGTELIKMLLEVRAKGGNLLLNIGPRADGTIPEEAERTLLEIGRWLEVNGEAIYGTRPWKIYGEGPTQVVAGSFKDTERATFTGQDFRFTTKGNTLYAIALAWPESGTLNVRALGRGAR